MQQPSGVLCFLCKFNYGHIIKHIHYRVQKLNFCSAQPTWINFILFYLSSIAFRWHKMDLNNPLLEINACSFTLNNKDFTKAISEIRRSDSQRAFSAIRVKVFTLKKKEHLFSLGYVRYIVCLSLCKKSVKKAQLKFRQK